MIAVIMGYQQHIHRSHRVRVHAGGRSKKGIDQHMRRGTLILKAECPYQVISLICLPRVLFFRPAILTMRQAQLIENSPAGLEQHILKTLRTQVKSPAKTA